ncbi:sigma-E factor negative regulatory protein [Vreelandella arcis]|uniref:Sigma-E factor negative regulatory protein RseA n=1 Tax=Vreelandella arcis TaxID=416873 RepID=A0A1G9ZRQ4_9GAMM|nr:sigma-E factor negative regulatory protein [Halomonas arcis]SDN23834.1 sigma-E factor negative regulatory protein RseA [Halomonas arcis]
MSQNTRESLSVLMDSESDELELRRVLKALPDDDDAADTWRRYHLARSMMQRERGVDVTADLSAGIMARLQGEPAPTLDDAVPARTGSVSFVRGAGVAAAVSLMVITGVQFFGNNAGTGSTEQGGGVASNTAPATSNQVQPVNLTSTLNATNGQTTVAPQADNMPMFEQTPFRVNGQASRGGLMNVSEGGFSGTGAQQGVSAQQGTRIDVEQLRFLQSYLEQQQGFTGSQSDSSMRSFGVTEPLGQR